MSGGSRTRRPSAQRSTSSSTATAPPRTATHPGRSTIPEHEAPGQRPEVEDQQGTPTLFAAAQVLPDDTGEEHQYDEDTLFTTPSADGEPSEGQYRRREHDGRTRRTLAAPSVDALTATETTQTGTRLQRRSADGAFEDVSVDEQTRRTSRTARARDLSLTREEARSTEQRDGDTASSTSDVERSATALLAGTREQRRTTRVERSEGEGDAQRGAATETEDRATTSIGGGAAQRETRRRIRRERTEGDRTTAQESERRGSMGLTGDENAGLGVRRGGAVRSRREDGDDFTERQASGDVTISERGVAARGSAEASGRRGALTARAQSSGDGRYRWSCDPVDEAHPEQGYTLTFVINLSASGSVTGGASRTEAQERRRSTSGRGNARGSARASVDASAGLTTTRRITQEQAQAFERASQRYESGGIRSVPGNQFPEFERLRALIRSGGAGTAAVGDADAASRLGEGESVELVLGAGAGLRADGSGDRGGNTARLNASAQYRYQRTLRVESVSAAPGSQQNLVDVTVTFVETTRLEAGGSGTMQGATAGGSVRRGTRDGESITVRLDARATDYRDVYGQITGTMTPSDLRSLAEREDVRQRTRARSSSREDSDGASGTVGAAGLQAGIGRDSRGRRTEATDADGRRTTEIVGEETASLTAGAAGIDVINWGETNTATGEASADGATLDLRQEERDNDIGQNVADAAETIRGNSLSDNLSGALQRSPREHLEHLVEQQRSRVSGFRLSAGEVEQLVQRASQTREWNACATRGVLAGAPQAWWALGRQLAALQAVPEDRDRAYQRNTRVVEAICDYVRNHGTYSQQTMRRALHHFGESRDRVVDDFDERSEQLGTAYEFPASIRREETRWRTATQNVESFPRQRDRLIREQGLEGVRDTLRSYRRDLERVRRAIQNCGDFEEARARAELLGDITRKLSLLDQYEGDISRRQEVDAVTGADRGDESGPPPSAPEGSDDRRQRLAADRERRKSDLRVNKRQERADLDRAREALQYRLGGLIGPDEDEVFDQTRRIKDGYTAWYSQVRGLRQVYRDLSVSESDWPISTGPGDERSIATYEPDIEQVIRIRLSMLGRMSESRQGWVRGSMNSTHAAWRREWQSY